MNNVRGIRSNFYTCICLDSETDNWILKEIDMREPIIRYIPEWMVIEYLNSKENKYGCDI